MILHVEKIVEEFYCNTSRLKKNILLQQLTVHIWIRSGFSYCFMLHQWQ